MMLLESLFKKLHLSSTQNIIAQNLFWAVLGKFVTLLGGLFVGIFVARYLGPRQYGLMNYVISYVALFQILATFGLDTIQVREGAKEKVSRNTIVGTAFALKLILACIFMLAVIITSWMMEADKYTTLLVFIYSFSIILNSFTVIRNHFTSILENEYVVKAEISRTVIGAGLKVILLLLHAALVWFVVALVFDFVLLASGYVVAYRTKIGAIGEWRFNLQYSKFLIHESFPLMLTSAAVFVYQRIDQIMIGNMIDKESVGYFSVAARFVEILIYVPMMLSQTITPVLVRTREQDEDEYARKGQKFMNLSLWTSIILAILTSALSYWIVRLTFGRAYLPAVAVLQVMAFKVASVALSNTAGAMLVAEGLQRYAIFRDLLGCVVCVGLNYLLLPRYGIIAAAYIAVISNLAAGYLADALIPTYRHLFVRQTRAVIVGWKAFHAFRIDRN